MKIKLYKQCFFILVFFCLFSNITANSSNNIKSYSKKTYQIIFLAYYHLEIMIFANLENFLLK